tara:strand:+ start:142 stop:393 length:252 start_codon:yes stop_codon:yes gene_type:complete
MTRIENVLSLFDGLSAAQIALERAGIEVGNYYASEIDKYCIKVTQARFPNTIQLGRASMGIDINKEFLGMALRRTQQQSLWFA